MVDRNRKLLFLHDVRNEGCHTYRMIFHIFSYIRFPVFWCLTNSINMRFDSLITFLLILKLTLGLPHRFVLCCHQYGFQNFEVGFLVCLQYLISTTHGPTQENTRKHHRSTVMKLSQIQKLKKPSYLCTVLQHRYSVSAS